MADDGRHQAGAKRRIRIPAALGDGSGDAHVGARIGFTGSRGCVRGSIHVWSTGGLGSESTPRPRRTDEGREAPPRGFRERDDKGGNAEEHHAEREGEVRVGLAGQVDLEGHRAGHALHGPGEGEGRAEFTEAAGKREGGAATKAGQDRWQGDLPEDARRRGSQGGGHLVEPLFART